MLFVFYVNFFEKYVLLNIYFKNTFFETGIQNLNVVVKQHFAEKINVRKYSKQKQPISSNNQILLKELEVRGWTRSCCSLNTLLGSNPGKLSIFQISKRRY